MPPQSKTKYHTIKSLLPDFPDEEELIWEFVTPAEWEEQKFLLTSISPKRWVNQKNETGESILKTFEKFASKESKATVKRYRSLLKKGKEIPPVIVSQHKKILVDGYHKLTAAFYEKIPYFPALDLDSPKPQKVAPT